MEGYWLIWCSIIIFILYTSGFKSIVLAYTAKQELLLYAIAGILLIYDHKKILLSLYNGNVQIYQLICLAIIPIALACVRNKFHSWGLMLLSGGLLGLLYCLYLSLFLIRRGYEPSMLEWSVYVCVIALLLAFILQRHQLLLVIIIAQLSGDFINLWHQQGQYHIRIGSVSWWEFVIFLFISTLCLYESLSFIAKRVKLINHKRMKS